MSLNEDPTIEEAAEETRELISAMATSIKTRDGSQELINAQDIPNEIRKYKDLSPVVKEYWDVRSYLTDISQLLLPTGDRVIDEHVADAAGTSWPHKYRIISSTGGDCTFFSNYRFCYCKEAMSTSSNKPIYYLLTCYKNEYNDILLCDLGTYRYTYNVGLTLRYGPRNIIAITPYRGYITSNKGTFTGNWSVNILVTDLPNCPLPVFDTLAEAYEYCRQEVTPTTIKPSSFPSRILSVNKKQYLALNKKLYYHWQHFKSDETSYSYAYTADIYYDYPIVAYNYGESDPRWYSLLTIYPGNNGGWFFAHVTTTNGSYDGYANGTAIVSNSIGDPAVQSGFNKIASVVWKNNKPTQTSNLSITANAIDRAGFTKFKSTDGYSYQDVFDYLVYTQTGEYQAPNNHEYTYKYSAKAEHPYQEYTQDNDWYTNFKIGCYNHNVYANLSYLGDTYVGSDPITKVQIYMNEENPGVYTGSWRAIHYMNQPNNQLLDFCYNVKSGDGGYVFNPYPANNYPTYTVNTFPNFQTEAELIEYLNS